MTDRLDDIKQRFQGFSRATQWAILGAIGIGLFLVWDSFVRPVTADWRQRAEELQTRVDKVRSSQAVVEELRKPAMADLVRAYGPVEVPKSENEGRNALARTVNGVLDKYRVKEPNFDQRSGGRLPKTALPGIARGKRINRLQGDLRFEAKTEDATAIIAELEASEVVESITTINISKGNPDWVNVRLSIESWVIGGAS